MRDPSWMQLNPQLRKTTPAEPEPAGKTDDRPLDLDAEYPYLGAWREYKRIWRAIWINGFAGWLTIAAMTVVLPRLGLERMLAVLFPVWTLVWFGVTMVAVLRMITFRCPRCGERFFSLGRSPALQMKCRACGLRKFAVNDAGKGLHQLKPPKD